MSISQDDDTVQLLGTVEISYLIDHVNKGHTTDFNFSGQIAQLRNCLPIRAAAMHICTDDPAIRLLVKIVKPFFALPTLSRVRIHCGGALEAQYQFLSYGIPVSALPIDPVHTNHHTAWVQHRKRVEEARERSNSKNSQLQPQQHQKQSQQQQPPSPLLSSTAQEMVTDSTEALLPPTPPMVTSSQYGQKTTTKNDDGGGIASPQSRILSNNSPTPLQPGPNDCILGRGRAIDQHVGNVQFRKYLQQHLKEYQETPQYLKAHIAEPIRQRLMKDHGVRFFKQVQSQPKGKSVIGGGGVGSGSGGGIGRTSSPSGPVNQAASSANNGGSGTTAATVWEFASETAVKEKILRTFRRIQLNEQKKQKQQQW